MLLLVPGLRFPPLTSLRRGAPNSSVDAIAISPSRVPSPRGASSRQLPSPLLLPRRLAAPRIFSSLHFYPPSSTYCSPLTSVASLLTTTALPTPHSPSTPALHPIFRPHRGAPAGTFRGGYLRRRPSTQEPPPPSPPHPPSFKPARPRGIASQNQGTPHPRPRHRGRLAQEVERGANHGLGVDLVVLVELEDVAGLAEALDAEAGDRRAEERERVRVPVDEGDDRDARAEQVARRVRVAVAEARRAWCDRNSRSADVMQTTSALPRSPPPGAPPGRARPSRR